MEERIEFTPSDEILDKIEGHNVRTVNMKIDRMHTCLYWSKQIANYVNQLSNVVHPLLLDVQFGHNSHRTFYVVFDDSIDSLKVIEYDTCRDKYYKIPPEDNYMDQINYLKIMIWEMYCLRPYYTTMASTEKNILYDITKWVVGIKFGEQPKEFYLNVASKEDPIDHDIQALLIQQTNGEKYKFEVEIIYMNYSSYEYIERKALRFKSTKALLNFLYYDIEGLGVKVI